MATSRKSTDLPPNSRLWDTVTRIQWALRLKDSDIAEILGMPLEEMLVFRAQKSFPSAAHVFGLAEVFGLPVESLISGSIDYKALAELYGGNLEHIPDRYAESAFSKRRAALPILTFLRKRYGDLNLERQLQYFQLHRDAFSRPDEKISIRFLVDFCGHLTRFGFQERDFTEIGTFSVDANRGGPVERAFGELRSSKEVYQALVEGLASRYDENWSYSMQKLTRDVATVRLEARSEVTEAMKTKKMGSALLCALKGGVGASLLAYKGLPHAQVKHTRCIHRGDAECLYEFDYSEANRIGPPSRGGSQPRHLVALS